MALRFCDSFDHYASADLLSKWSSVSDGDYAIGAIGRFGNGLSWTMQGRSVRKVLDAQATWYLGVAYKFLSPSTAAGVMGLRDDASQQIELGIDATQRLTISRAGTLLGTGTKVLAANVWYYLELGATIHNSAGVAIGRVDGVNEINLSGIDTQATADAWANVVSLGVKELGFGGSCYYDDFYACDGTGSSPTNTFLGDVRVEALFPSGNGNSSQLDGSDGNQVDNYLLVDEVAQDGDTTYVESPDINDKDTYAYSDLTSTAGTVYGVQVLPFARKTDAGTRRIKTVARLSGTEVDSAEQTLSTTYQYLSDIRETKPGGGAWTIPDVNNGEYGVKVSS